MYVFKGVRSSGFLEGVVQVIVDFLGVDARVFEVHFFRVWFGSCQVWPLPFSMGLEFGGLVLVDKHG